MFNPNEMCRLLKDFVYRAEYTPARKVITSQDLANIQSLIKRLDAEYEKAINNGEIHYRYMPKENPKFSSDWRKLVGETAKFIRPDRLIRYHDGYSWVEYTLKEEDIRNGYIHPHRDFVRVDLFRPPVAEYNYILVSDKHMEASRL
jgi:hypothetical protein